jgi:hypothetical protein
MMLMEWPGITMEQYDRVMSALGFDKNPPKGGLFHAAGVGPRGLRVIDIWESRQDFERFQSERLGPEVQKAGFSGQPNVEFVEVHNIHPDVGDLKRHGTWPAAAHVR